LGSNSSRSVVRARRLACAACGLLGCILHVDVATFMHATHPDWPSRVPAIAAPARQAHHEHVHEEASAWVGVDEAATAAIASSSGVSITPQAGALSLTGGIPTAESTALGVSAFA
jgi:hypothetical protein